jgi:hypothetical protein
LVKCRLKVQGLGEKQSRHFSRDDIWARHRGRPIDSGAHVWGQQTVFDAVKGSLWTFS